MSYEKTEIALKQSTQNFKKIGLRLILKLVGCFKELGNFRSFHKDQHLFLCVCGRHENSYHKSLIKSGANLKNRKSSKIKGLSTQVCAGCLHCVNGNEECMWVGVIPAPLSRTRIYYVQILSNGLV
jgi:hypothetical protein